MTVQWQEPEEDKQSNVLSCNFPSVKNIILVSIISSISVWQLAVLRFIISIWNRLSSVIP